MSQAVSRRANYHAIQSGVWLQQVSSIFGDSTFSEMERADSVGHGKISRLREPRGAESPRSRRGCALVPLMRVGAACLGDGTAACRHGQGMLRLFTLSAALIGPTSHSGKATRLASKLDSWPWVSLETAGNGLSGVVKMLMV